VQQGRLGDALRAQTQWVEAQSAYAEALEISVRLTALDPSHAGWQRELAAAHGRLGEAMRARGDLAGAAVAFERTLGTSQQLAELEP
jgi:tetratricopeptide (TPR) repeat protein